MPKLIRWAHPGTDHATLEYNDGDGWKSYHLHPLAKLIGSSRPERSWGYATMQFLLRKGYVYAQPPTLGELEDNSPVDLEEATQRAFNPSAHPLADLIDSIIETQASPEPPSE